MTTDPPSPSGYDRWLARTLDAAAGRDGGPDQPDPWDEGVDPDERARLLAQDDAEGAG